MFESQRVILGNHLAAVAPRKCPSPLEVKKGTLTVAILGTPDLDPTQVVSVELLGEMPTDYSYRDVATPFVPYIGKEFATDCTAAGRDGWTDLVMKFDRLALIQAIEIELGRPLDDGEVLILQLTGYLADDTPILGEDVVVVSGDTGGSGGPVKKENCKNGKDDDGDALTDCADPDCTGSKWCQ